MTHPAVLALSFLNLFDRLAQKHRPHQSRLVCLILSRCDQKPPAWKNDKPFHPCVCVTLQYQWYDTRKQENAAWDLQPVCSYISYDFIVIYEWDMLQCALQATVPASLTLCQVCIVHNREVWRENTWCSALCVHNTAVTSTYFTSQTLHTVAKNEVLTSISAFQCLFHHVLMNVTIMDYFMFP